MGEGEAFHCTGMTRLTNYEEPGYEELWQTKKGGEFNGESKKLGENSFLSLQTQFG